MYLYLEYLEYRMMEYIKDNSPNVIIIIVYSVKPCLANIMLQMWPYPETSGLPPRFSTKLK